MTQSSAAALPPHSGPRTTHRPAGPPIDLYVRAGAVVCGLLFGGFGIWASVAPLASAALAPGIVRVDSHKKTLQHPEGGIVEKVLVREGDRVAAGQPLIRLNPLDVTADFDALRGMSDALAAQEARLVAQRDGLAQVRYPTSLTERRSEASVTAIIDGQDRILVDQARMLDSQSSGLAQRIEQFEAQKETIEAKDRSVRRQADLLDEELVGVRDLYNRGFERKSRVLALERQLADARGEVEANQSRLAAVDQQIRETRSQIATLRNEAARKASEELREVQTKKAELEERLRKATAKVNRTDIVAPESGTVLNLKYFAPGEVIKAGTPIVDIVPANDKLVVEARVNPLDIDVVHPGLDATVRLVAYKQRTTPVLNGKVVVISADALADERNGQAYFLATVEIDGDEAAKLPQLKLFPGMPADVAILTGERTFLEYLTQPLSDSFAHAFREQ